IPKPSVFLFPYNVSFPAYAGKSPLDGAARHFCEVDPQADDVRPERPRLGGTAGSARKAFSHEGQRRLDGVAGELPVRPLGVHTSPASLSIGVVFVDLDADLRVLAQH